MDSAYGYLLAFEEEKGKKNMRKLSKSKMEFNDDPMIVRIDDYRYTVVEYLLFLKYIIL